MRGRPPSPERTRIGIFTLPALLCELLAAAIDILGLPQDLVL